MKFFLLHTFLYDQEPPAPLTSVAELIALLIQVITDLIQGGQSMTVALPSLFGAQGEPYYYYYYSVA